MAKLNILSHPHTLYTVGEALARQIDGAADSICLLASSGLPLGIIASLAKSTPLVFYNSKGWGNLGGQKNILPTIGTGKKYALIDSHIKTGRTSYKCSQVLTEEYNGKVVQICAPFRNDPTFVHKVDSSYQVLADYNVARKMLCLVTGLSEMEIDGICADPGHPFWFGSSSLESEPNEFRAFNPYGKWRWFVPTPRTLNRPRIRLVSTRTQELIRSQTQLTSDGVWRLFLEPQIVETVCRIAGEKLQIEKYDYLIGVQHLGLALAIALAYCNRNKFHGKLGVWLGEESIRPDGDLSGKRVALISMRSLYGTYIADAVTEVQQSGGRVEDVIFGLTDFKARSLWERWRQISLSRLAASGISLSSLS